MSTFETVKENMLKDMARNQVHTAESWADILLRNTARLTDCEQQHLFWNWMTNPENDEAIPACKIVDGPQAKEVLPAHTSVPYRADEEEKEHDVSLKNTYHKNGLGCYVLTAPATKTSGLSLKSPACEVITEDETRAPETSSTPLEPCEQKEDSIASRYLTSGLSAAFSC